VHIWRPDRSCYGVANWNPKDALRGANHYRHGQGRSQRPTHRHVCHPGCKSAPGLNGYRFQSYRLQCPSYIARSLLTGSAGRWISFAEFVSPVGFISTKFSVSSRCDALKPRSKRVTALTDQGDRGRSPKGLFVVWPRRSQRWIDQRLIIGLVECGSIVPFLEKCLASSSKPNKHFRSVPSILHRRRPRTLPTPHIADAPNSFSPRHNYHTRTPPWFSPHRISYARLTNKYFPLPERRGHHPEIGLDIRGKIAAQFTSQIG